MENNVFSKMPPIPYEDMQWARKNFRDYLFFKTVKDGVREYTCTACGKKFERGRKVLLRTTTPNDRKLAVAKPGDICECPVCGKPFEVKNAKRCNFDKLYTEKSYLFCLVENENEVWFRGVNFWKKFNEELTPIVGQWECYRYKLTPGKAEMWMKYNFQDTSFYYSPTVTDAFSWNHGLYTEKYDYSFYYTAGKNLSDTFLRYNGYDTYIQHAFYSNPSEIKYLCWYARHPQIEMLAKIGHFNIIDQMMFYNTDNPSFLDWSASTPWELLRLTHTEYNEYVKRGSDFELLKTYHRIGGKGVKDFDKAAVVKGFFKYKYRYNQTDHKSIITTNALAKKEGKTAYDAIKYFEKVSRNSAGSCHHCPGITVQEAYNLWADYIQMLKTVNPQLKNVPIFPHDLKEKHDELLRQRKKIEAKNRAKAEAKELQSLVEKHQRFKKVTKICAEIADKYSFTDGEYTIIVPENLEEILKESLSLQLCIHRTKDGRYFDRIQRRETYLLFLRRNKKLKKPWYVIEVEPNGTVQQKRTTNDSQYEKDVKAFTPFLRKWQNHVQTKLTLEDMKLQETSKKLREENFADLRKTKKRVNYGDRQGELLIDVLEKDLLEVIA